MYRAALTALNRKQILALHVRQPHYGFSCIAHLRQACCICLPAASFPQRWLLVLELLHQGQQVLQHDLSLQQGSV